MEHRNTLLIFDWDGTLMDSIQHIVNSLQYAMRCLEVSALSEEATKDVIGLSLREAVQALFPDRLDAQFVDRYVAHFKTHYQEDLPQTTSLFPGAEDTLRTLKQQGYQLAIATGKSRAGLTRALNATGIGHYFSASRCADESRSKPNADMIHAILRELKVSPHQAVMIGDTEYDLHMAHNAGVSSVGVTYGVHKPERLLAFRPLGLIHAITELPDFLTRE